jgi:hypothetical protein
MPRRLLATMLVFLLAGIPLFGQTTSLGVVTQSSGGHLNSSVATVGATIFNGDLLNTEAPGALAVRAGSVQLALSDDSAILIGHEGATLAPVLQRGSVSFRVEGGGSLLLIATDVRVRPQSSELTVGQMTLETCAVVITSRTQALEVVAGKETKIVQEGQSYRVSFEGACGKRSNQVPLAPAHSRFLLIPVIAAIATGIGLHKAYESPDRP